MPQQPSNPPPKVAVRQYTTPVTGEGFFTERVDYTVDEYRVIERGAKYADQVNADPNVIEQFPDLRFLKESRDPLFYPWALRLWATDRTSEDTYNSAVEYVSEAVNFPAYTRTYMVRRDLYDSIPAKEIGTPLDSLVAVKMIDQGADYTFAEFQIDPENDAEIKPIIDTANGGKIVSAIITNQGSGFTTAPTITVVGDGGDARAVAILQPQSAVLVDQKKSELPDNHPLRNEYVLVTRVYETLPGPWVYSEKVDQDGVVITVKKRRNRAADVTAGDEIVGNVWDQTTKDGQDDFVAEEINESRTVRISNTQGNHLTTERVDDDGDTVTVTREMASQAYFDTITPRERIDAGSGPDVGTDIWTRITSEPIDDIRCWLITERRHLPGNPIPETKLDDDGKPIDSVRTLKQTTTITESETIVAGVWIKKESKAVSDLVAWEVVTAREVPGNIIPSANVERDHEVAIVQRTLKDTTAITPSATESAGVITTVEKKEVSDLVSQEIRTQKRWLDEASYSLAIPEGIIPESFRATIPFKTISHILAGTASMPTLGAQEFEHSQKQLTKLLYEDRVVTLGNITLPAVQIEYLMTELNGGGVLQVTRALTASQPPNTVGYLITAFRTTPLGNGMWFSELRSLYLDLEWPILFGTHIDEKYLITVNYAKQVVLAGTLGGIEPDGTIREVTPHDKWRSIQIASKLDLTSLPSPTTWESVIYKRFPSELKAAIFIYGMAWCGCSSSIAFALETNIKQGYAGPCRGRITESFTNGPPPGAISVTQFFPEAHSVGVAWASACFDGSCVTKSGARTFFIPATLHGLIDLGANVIVPTGLPPRTVSDGVTVAGGHEVTSATANFQSTDLGALIEDLGMTPALAPGTVIAEINSTTSVNVEPAALLSGTSLDLKITPRPAAVTQTLAATTPPALPAPGTIIIHDVIVQRWRFGIFYRRLEEVFMPG